MAETKILTVTQVSELIKMILEGSPLMKSLTVKGEISNLTIHRTGHVYFSLKDGASVIRAVMFRAQAEKLRFAPEDGLKVLAKGRITVYPASGAYQIVLEDLIPDGIGALQLAFEQLKRKLAQEGLFDPARKRPIPKLPRTVGVITSPTGAAIRDILQIAKRRFPFAKVILYPAAVQGDLAPAQLREGVFVMGGVSKPDVIIIGRGGGSAEDLWAFNDEALVRAVAACEVPIISAVGHEIDFTLCDFAADLRAPTPSAAAELAFPDTEQMMRRFDHVTTLLVNRMHSQIEAQRALLKRHATSRALRVPIELIRDRADALGLMRERLLRAVNQDREKKTMQLTAASALLDAMSPLRVLARGYTVMRNDENGEVIRSASQLQIGDRVSLTLMDGEAKAEIVEQKESKG